MKKNWKENLNWIELNFTLIDTFIGCDKFAILSELWKLCSKRIKTESGHKRSKVNKLMFSGKFPIKPKNWRKKFLRKEKKIFRFLKLLIENSSKNPEDSCSEWKLKPAYNTLLSPTFGSFLMRRQLDPRWANVFLWRPNLFCPDLVRLRLRWLRIDRLSTIADEPSIPRIHRLDWIRPGRDPLKSSFDFGSFRPSKKFSKLALRWQFGGITFDFCLRCTLARYRQKSGLAPN